MLEEFKKELERIYKERLQCYVGLNINSFDSNIPLYESKLSFYSRVHSELVYITIGYVECFIHFVAWEAKYEDLIPVACEIETNLVFNRYEELKNGK